MKLHHQKNRRTPGRLGTATVELGVCLPLIVLIAFGAVEGASMIFLKQTLVQSAYEGIKVAVKNNTTRDDVVAATNTVLNGHTLNDVSVSIQPNDFSSVERGEYISVTVSAPSDANSVFPFGPFQGRRLEYSAVMVKE